MKVYICGKISGLPTEQVKAKFNMAEKQVEAFGHEPVNPLKNGLDDSFPWERHLVVDLETLICECDGIYLLTDWEDSPGARIEEKVAQETGKEMFFQPAYAAYKTTNY